MTSEQKNTDQKRQIRFEDDDLELLVKTQGSKDPYREIPLSTIEKKKLFTWL